MFRVLDTAGLEEADDSLAARVRLQTEQALEQADLALFMIDARVGITPTDEHFSKWLRTAGIETWVIANKCEAGLGMPAFWTPTASDMATCCRCPPSTGMVWAGCTRTWCSGSPRPEGDEPDDDGLNLAAAAEARKPKTGAPTRSARTAPCIWWSPGGRMSASRR